MENNITEIMQVIALLISTGAIVVVTYFIKKYGVNKVDKVLKFVTIAVKAVEQMDRINGWDVKQKKSEALDYITKTLNKKSIKVNKTDLDMMIDPVVYEFNKNRPKYQNGEH